MAELLFLLQAHHTYGSMHDDLFRIQSESDFTQVALEGIQEIQRMQRYSAPIGKGRLGRGETHGRIPRSIKPARVQRLTGGSAAGVSRTTYGPAIFTNEGTGIHRAGGSPYFIGVGDEGEGFNHPGIRGTHWWERGLDLGSPMALRAFERKVERMLRLKGRL